MNVRRIFLVMVLLAAGVGAAVFFVKSTSKSPVGMVNVLVASKDIPMGTTLGEANLLSYSRLELRQEQVVPVNAIKVVEAIREMELVRSVPAGSILTTLDISVLEDSPIEVPPGLVLVKVRATPEWAGNTFLLPGMRIDLIDSEPDPADPNRTISRFFIVGAIVLRAWSNRPSDLSTVGTVWEISLAIRPADAEEVERRRAKARVFGALFHREEPGPEPRQER